MTLAELRDRTTKFLAYDLDNFEGETPTDPELDSQVNFAMRLMSREMHLVNPKVQLRLKANQSIVNYQDTDQVEQTVVRPYHVTIDGNKLWNARRDSYGLWTYGQFVQEHPTWESASSGTPTIAATFGSRQFILFEPASAAIAAQTDHYIAGQVLCNRLTGVRPYDDPARQGFPDEFHEGIAYLASVFAARPNVTEQEGLQRLAMFNAEWEAYCKAARNENRRLFSLHDPDRSDYADYIPLG